jgi:hypothetical protein
LHKQSPRVRHADHFAEPADAVDPPLEWHAWIRHNPEISAEWVSCGQQRTVRHTGLRQKSWPTLFLEIVMWRTQEYRKLIDFGLENDVVLTGQGKADQLYSIPRGASHTGNGRNDYLDGENQPLIQKDDSNVLASGSVANDCGRRRVA